MAPIDLELLPFYIQHLKSRSNNPTTISRENSRKTSWTQNDHASDPTVRTWQLYFYQNRGGCWGKGKEY